MLKSWKTRALATAGAIALAAPFAFMGGAFAVAGTATITSVQSASGNNVPGDTLTVTGSGCIQNTATAQTVRLRLSGPSPSTSVISTVPGVISNTTTGDFTGTLQIPANAQVGNVFQVEAACLEGATVGTPATTTVTVSQGSILTTGGTTGGTTTLTGITGGLTGTSGATSGATTAGTTGTTTGVTTGVPTPIPQTPTFTG